MMRLDPEFLARPIAHRGLHNVAIGCVENSLGAIEAACALGYGIEIDVQLSGDGQAIVFHDYTLERLCGRDGAVRDFDAATLSSIDFSNGEGTIPTLTKVLDVVKGQVPLLIEIKDQSQNYGQTGIGPLEQGVADALRAYAGVVAVMSFNPHSVASFGVAAPAICRGLTTGGFGPKDAAVTSASAYSDLLEIAAFDDCGATFISHDVRELEVNAVQKIKARGVPVLCWTVRSQEQEKVARTVAQNITFEGYNAAFPNAKT